MKRGLIIVLVLSMLVGMMSLSSFAAVRNYQNGGMMNGNFGGMMGKGNWNTDKTNAGVLAENAISLEAANDIGKSYLEKELSSEYTLDKDGIATGDFYTFFIESKDKTVGRLSVNALTSEVWLHNCRGLLQ